MGEHDAHRQRVYRRFLAEGLAGFEEHNALEFLLFLAHSRGDTTDTARRLLREFGSVANVLDAPVEQLQKVEGVGPSAAVVLKFVPQMCAYYLQSKASGNKKMDSVSAVAAYLMPKFYGRTEEAFFLLTLDDRRQLLRCTCISEGIANATSVSLAKVISETTASHATGVVLAHNHPRGIALPSSNDLSLTAEIYKGLKMIQVELVDHLIFTENEYLSFADSRYLANIRETY